MALPALLVVHKVQGLAAAVENHLLLGGSEAFVGVGEAEAVLVGQGLEPGALPGRGGIVGAKGPLVKGLGLVRHNQIQVEFHGLPQTGAVRAGSHRIVKGKEPRL